MKDILRMVLALLAISGISAVGLAWVEDLTDERIAEEIRKDTLRAIAAVLPGYDNAPDLEAVTLEGVPSAFSPNGSRRGSDDGPEPGARPDVGRAG